jgi:hypothetical protein
LIINDTYGSSWCLPASLCPIRLVGVSVLCGVARLFGISLSSAKRYTSTARCGGSLAPRTEVDGRRRQARAPRDSSKGCGVPPDDHRCRTAALPGAPCGNPTQPGCRHRPRARRTSRLVTSSLFVGRRTFPPSGFTTSGTLALQYSSWHASTPKFVQELLGHRSTHITLETYSRVIQGDGRRAGGRYGRSTVRLYC